MMRRILLLCGVCLSFFVAGCQGERYTGFMESAKPEGVWRADGTLIRSYNVTMEQAIDAIQKLMADEHMIRREASRTEFTGTIEVRDDNFIIIRFLLWSPPEKGTDIGIEYADGNLPGSVATFEKLEKHLPGKRIIAGGK